ncbi:ATP-binding protein [Sandaracinus amylolyticus]|uniref:Anti-sigma B factor RsbT n=1 Tax=Sandaracinus amylolyticus TaxID=927083 RepID=A0A0F6W5F4_9BACT|nr:ATP-binding protein [Sandaracinus amylolyticus]AKF07918.1 Anti-sigma B factor RsbT [Sandaracinus amylolyticus]
MPDGEARRVVCSDARDRLVASIVVRAFAGSLGFPPRACLELAIAAAELASNAVRHGGGGVLEVRVLRDGARVGVELACSDEGQGIPDPDAAVRDGWSRGRALGPDDPWHEGLGRGLGAVSRAVDELMFVPAREGRHVVRARRWIPRSRA